MTTTHTTTRSAERSAARSAEKIEAAQALIASAVAEIQTGTDWMEFLKLQSKLHAYSPRNVILLTGQHYQAYLNGTVPEPYPSMVAGFNTWKALGR